MNVAAEWYKGDFADYESLPWLHEMKDAPPMPWMVVDINPSGYIVFACIDGAMQKFKMLNRPIVVVGDIIL